MTKNQQLLAKIGGGSFVLLSFLAVSPQASAVTFVSNLNETNNGLGALVFPQWQGSNFTTGNSTYTLNSVSALLGEATNSPNFFFRLYSNNSGVPGTILTSFTPTAAISTTLAVNNFTPDSAVQLAPNTTYWLVGGVPAADSGDYEWGYTLSSNETGLDGWTIGDIYAFSNDQGGSWDPLTDLSFQFSVDATDNNTATTPEPSSLVALLGLGGLALTSRLKKR